MNRFKIYAIQDDITRPVYNLLRGYKQDAEAYERALKEIREKAGRAMDYGDNSDATQFAYVQSDKALKGNYHKDDFTDFCEKNPITEHPA